MKIYVTGVSGTGKTTIAKKLEKRGFRSISIDEVPGLCFWINKKTKEKVLTEVELNKKFIDTHNWICDVELLKKLLDKNTRTIFVLGMASNQTDYLDLFDKTLLLQCRPETFISRIESRVDNDFGREKSAQEVILDMYRNFEDETIKRGAVSIDAEKPVDIVVEQIVRQIV